VLSRRRVVGGAIAAGLLLRNRASWGSPPQPSDSVDFAVPAGACDCHTHVIGDPAKYPLSPMRHYTPPPALPSELARLHQVLGIQRVVIVTPSAYGTDNSATLWGLSMRAANARGIVVIDDNTPDHQLDTMHRAGVRGTRLYLADAGVKPESARRQFTCLAGRLAKRNWHIQIFTTPDLVVALKDLVLESPVPVVFDHFGGARGELGVTQPGFVELLHLMGSGKAYVKISAAYRFSSQPPNYGDMAPLARSLVDVRADRVLWGTDWPHTNGTVAGQSAAPVSSFIKVDDAYLLNLFAAWVPESKIRNQILVGNPRQLYDF
jgi:predicted TIM-barrel fold metal-dependent hydrolase